MQASRPVIVVGYSGHCYVALEALTRMGRRVTGYCDLHEKAENPYGLAFHGSESSAEALMAMSAADVFVAIGENGLRRKVFQSLLGKARLEVRAIDPSAVISATAAVGQGVLCSPRSTINAQARIGDGAIINTGAIVEHQCQVGAFAHIGPGAVLAGDVKVGDDAFVGAQAVVRQGLSVGRRAIVGAGAVVVRNVLDGEVVVGNPARALRRATVF